MIRRDKYGQQKKRMSGQDYDLLAILEEVAMPDVNGDKTLLAYLTDIKDLLGVL